MFITHTVWSTLPYQNLILKKGYIVIILPNLDRNNLHVNVAHYIVEILSNNVFYCISLTYKIMVSFFTLSIMMRGPEDDIFLVPGFTRTKFLIIFCFSITTNKSQGHSLTGKLGPVLRDELFSYVQLSITLSRTTQFYLMYFWRLWSTSVVYSEVLSLI